MDKIKNMLRLSSRTIPESTSFKQHDHISRLLLWQSRSSKRCVHMSLCDISSARGPSPLLKSITQAVKQEPYKHLLVVNLGLKVLFLAVWHPVNPQRNHAFVDLAKRNCRKHNHSLQGCVLLAPRREKAHPNYPPTLRDHEPNHQG